MSAGARRAYVALARAERRKRRPPPPDELVGALQDHIHPASGRLLRAGVVVRAKK